MEIMETVTEVTEAVDEAVTEVITYNGYDMTLKASNSKVVIGIIGLVLLFAAIIAIIVLVKKKHVGSGFGLFGGIATYLVFYYFAISVVSTLIFTFPLKKYVVKENDISTITSASVYIIVYTLVGTLVPLFGRILSNKSFAYRIKTFGHNFSFGQGIACTQAVFTMSTLFQMVASMVIINRSGLETLVSGAKTQADANAMLDSAMELINYKSMALIMLIIVALLLMLYQLIITIPLFALHQKKINPGWYGMVFGSYLVIEVLQHMYERGIVNEIVEFILVLLVVGVVTYFSYGIYRKHYKSEERDLEKEKEDRQKKINESRKIPRFDNLSNL